MSANTRKSGIMPRRSISSLLLLLLLLLTATLSTHCDAAFIEFTNCLPASTTNASPLPLQWVPLFFNARLDTSNSSYPLNVTLFGNVTGQQTRDMPYPPPDSPIWRNNSDPFGKITETGSSGRLYTARTAEFTFLDYRTPDLPRATFCNTQNYTDLINATCPLGPLFNANASDPQELHAFTVGQVLGSPYQFSTLTGTIRIESGDDPSTLLGCISASITPDLGARIRALLTWLPAAILILKAISTLAAAIYSPWGSSDIFRWSSNYGRDEDLLRLVTPGFGDCLQYIQFVLLTGSLTLQYPGFYQPAVSEVGWSCLLFNESFVSHGSGSQSLVDGVYVTTGSYGLERMSQLTGMTQPDDIWACFAIWLAAITGLVILLCQLGFFSRWTHRKLTNTTEEDLRRKNLPFTLGNLIRLMFNYFILPIVALSFFQLVIAGSSPISVVVVACILLVVMILSAGWILRVIFRTKPRTLLFDDMQTVLLYGPFYNTYSDSAAPFALVPVFITFMRGVAIGAVQPSGIAQIVILAICEVILILTLNGLRPFQGQTSMNLYHTIFSTVRLITVLLSIAFVPRLGVSEGSKGWVGYVILILHACVLVFGFFLNAAQTLLEVIARALGVGGDSHGAVRGSILTFRMLKKRQDRPATGDRQSLMSTAMLRDDFDPVRSRSMSASSQQLLNQAGQTTPSMHRLSGFENFSSAGELASPSVDAESTAYFGAAVKPASKRSTDLTGATDNFYRPPRQRRGTGDLITPGAKSRQSTLSADFPYSDSPGTNGQRGISYGGSMFAGRDSPAAAYMRDRNDSEAENGPRTDYAVREVDQYYRGERLAGSGAPARKLKTGPADPLGPAANAQSWFHRMFFGARGKQDQENSKGFEVVRSTRAPPDMQQGVGAQEDYEMVNSPPMHAEPYTDSPPSQHVEPQAVTGAERDLGHARQASDTFNFGFNHSPVSPIAAEDRPSHDTSRIPDLIGTHPALRPSLDSQTHPPLRPDEAQTHPAFRPSIDSNREQHPGMRAEMPSRGTTPTPGHSRNVSERQLPHISEVPTLSPIESVGGIDMPSRFNSRATTTNTDLSSRFNSRASTNDPGRDWLRAVDRLDWGDHSREGDNSTPTVPERSSKRASSGNATPRRHSGMNFTGFDNDLASPPDERHYDDLERPTSFAVSHHRAADSITRNSFGAGQIASAAEVLSDDEK